jgi:acyl carrier protein
MTREQIEQKLIELAAEKAGVPAVDITPATHFVNDLEFDSLDVVEYAMDVEDHFHLNVPDDKADELATVGEVIDFVVEQLKAAPATSP